MSRWWPRSLAGQAIALQIVVIALVVLAGSVLALLDARRDGDAAARQQVIGIATALADSPSTAAAIESGRATEILQPVTEAVRRTPISRSSRSWRPTEPGSPTPTRARSAASTSAPSNRRCAARHSARPTPARWARRSARWRRSAPVRPDRRAGVGGHPAAEPRRALACTVDADRGADRCALAISFVGVWAIRRRLLRQTHGLRPDELRVMYEHHDAILHSVSEGLIVLDRDGVVLVNDEAAACWRCRRARCTGRTCRSSCARTPPAPATRCMSPTTGCWWSTDPRRPGDDSEVVTIRDRTELQGAFGELSSLQVLTDRCGRRRMKRPTSCTR